MNKTVTYIWCYEVTHNLLLIFLCVWISVIHSRVVHVVYGTQILFGFLDKQLMLCHTHRKSHSKLWTEQNHSFLNYSCFLNYFFPY